MNTHTAAEQVYRPVKASERLPDYADIFFTTYNGQRYVLYFNPGDDWNAKLWKESPGFEWLEELPAAPVSQPAPVLNTTMYGVCRNPSCLSCKGTGEMPVTSPTTNEIHYHYCYGSFFAPVPHRTESPQPAPAEGYIPCGGCGAKTPKERCINCHHDFGQPAPEGERKAIRLPHSDYSQKLFDYLSQELNVTAMPQQLHEIADIVAPYQYPYKMDEQHLQEAQPAEGEAPQDWEAKVNNAAKEYAEGFQNHECEKDFIDVKGAAETDFIEGVKFCESHRVAPLQSKLQKAQAEIKSLKGEAPQDWKELEPKDFETATAFYHACFMRASKQATALQSQLQEAEARIKELEGTLHSICHDAYPTDVFPPITSEQWKEIHEVIKERFGFPIDRLSAEYGRILRKPLIDEAREALNSQNETK